MKALRHILCIFIVAFLLSCTTTYTSSVLQAHLGDWGLYDAHRQTRNNQWQLAYDGKLALLPVSITPKIDNIRTRNKLNISLERAFVTHFPNAEVLHSSLQLDQALMVAANQGCELLVAVKLRETQNQLNTWNELREGRHMHPTKKIGRDHIVVQLLFFDVQSSSLLDVMNLDSRAAFFKMDDALPMHLFENSINKALSSISYRPTY